MLLAAAIPILIAKCLACHNTEAKVSAFDLSTREALMRGGAHGAAVSPGAAAQSRLVQYVSSGKMPPAQPLTPEEVDQNRQWIDAGAQYDQPKLTAHAAKPEPRMTPAFLLDRGSLSKPLEEAPPGTLTAIGQLAPDLPNGTDAERRLALANHAETIRDSMLALSGSLKPERGGPGFPLQKKQTIKQRGPLDDTLLVWTTEFGRLPISEGLGEGGRDHNPEGYTSFLAGPGLKKGFSYGSTDELGYKAADNPVTLYDFHATILHLLGLDHTRLTYYHNGPQRRLTDVHGQVLREVLA